MRGFYDKYIVERKICMGKTYGYQKADYTLRYG